MKRKIIHGLLGGTALLLAPSFSSLALGLQLLSTVNPADGPPPVAGGDSWAPIISPDGRFVLFASTANNLLSATNGSVIPLAIPASVNVFLRDRVNRTNVLVSVNLSGVCGGNGNSWPVALSTNGQFALFESTASDLVGNDTNNAPDVFLRDLSHGTTLLVSVSTNGGGGNGPSRSSVMTPDGRYVAFVSAASNLVPGDSNGIPDVFIRDLQTKTTTLVSAGAISTNSSVPTGGSEAPEITPNGRYVCFYSTATNLVTGVPIGGDIYVRDTVSGTTVWASSYARTAVPSNSVFSFNHAISADGQFVAYEASAALSTVGTVLRYNTFSGVTDIGHTNAAVPTGAYEDISSLDLSPDGRFTAFIANTNGTTGATTCAELWDAMTGTMTLVSGDPTGQVQSNSVCGWPVVDSTGQYVAFLSTATNLTASPLVGDYHLYLRNISSGTLTLLDADTNGVGSPISAATFPSLTPDLHFLAFECADASLVPNDRNRDYDVFVRDLTTGISDLVSAHDPALPSLSPNGPSTLATTSVSSNGQFVAFASESENLVINDTNLCRDIFMRDVLNSNTILVSVATNGFNGDGVSSDPAISSDGRYVAFSSRADNLVLGDNNGMSDVFLRDLQSGTTTLVSVNTNGIGPGDYDSYAISVSAGGRFVLFRSLANNIAPGIASLSFENVFLRDMLSSTTYALTLSGDAFGSFGELLATMTPDGRFVAYQDGQSAVLYIWDSLAARNVYTNRLVGALTSLAISADGNWISFFKGAPSDVLSVVYVPTSTWTMTAVSGVIYQHLQLNSDGRYLGVIQSILPNGTNFSQIYFLDLQAGTNVLVSHTSSSAAGGNGNADFLALSADGRFVAYRSAATNIVPSDTNGVPDVFLWDRLTGSTTLLSANQTGASSAANRSLAPVFSGDSQSVFFESWAPDLLAQDFNQSSDLFGLKLYSSGSLPVFQIGVVPSSHLLLTWPIIPGRSYGVQFKYSLDDPNWQNLNTGVTVIGSQAYFQDPAPDPDHRFYRVVAF